MQFPWQKINHALLLGGNQGIGKDTLLEPVKYAVGAANFHEVSPRQAMGRFNGFLKSVVLRISEARDLGESDRFKFYDHLKTITVTPPGEILVDQKNMPEHLIMNCCGVIITTNYRDGLYLPADDRRVYVAWSEESKEEFEQDYFKHLYGWYRVGGMQHVAAYLMQLDLSAFDPKAPPPKSEAFRVMVAVGRAPEEAELADVLDRLANPAVVTLRDIVAAAGVVSVFAQWLEDRKNHRLIPHRLESCGYTRIVNPNAKDGYWRVTGARVAIYVRQSIKKEERMRAVLEYTNMRA